MEKETVILNRFNPGIPSPIFFAGRKEEITEYLLLLEDMAKGAAYHKRIYVLMGENGIGKSSFLLRLKKQIQEDMYHYIPVYTSCMDFLEIPAYFYKNFFSSIEESLNSSSFRRELFAKFFRKESWQQNVIKIAPKLGSILQKFNVLETKSQLIKGFIRILADAYMTFESLKELLLLLNWIFQESNLFFLWILDHPEDLNAKPELAEILAQNLSLIQRSYRRYLILLSPDEQDWKTTKQENYEGKGFIPLLNRNTFLSIESIENVSAEAIPLLKRLQLMERLAVINILPTMDVDTISRAIKAHCASQYLMFKFSAMESESLAKYIREISLRLLTETKEALAKITDASIFNQEGTTETTKLLKSQIMDAENDLARSMNFFYDLLTRIDSNLQNFKNAFLVIFLEDIEKFLYCDLENKVENNTAFSPANSTKKISVVYRNKYLSPSLAFIQFFHFLEICFQRLKNISLVMITKLPQFEIANVCIKSIPEIYEQSSLKELRGLPKEDSLQMIKEIAARSGVSISDEIASDIYERTGGKPLALQHFGHYILSCMEKQIPSGDSSSLKKLLMRRLDVGMTGYKNILQEGTDGRARIVLSKEFYQSISPASLEELYQRKLSSLGEISSKNILQMMLAHDGNIETKNLAEKCKEVGIQVSDKEIETGIQELKEQKLVVSVSDKTAVLEPGLSRFLKRSLISATEEKKVSEKQLKTISRETLKQFISTTKKVKSVPLLMPGAPKSSNYDIEYLGEAIEWLENDSLPSEKALANVSKRVSLDENSPLFKVSTSYIYALCNIIQKKINADIDVARIFSIFKDYLVVSLEQQGKTDLLFALKKTFFGSRGLSKLYPQDFLIGKMYFMMYQVTEKAEELEKSLEFFYNSFQEIPIAPETKEIFWQMEMLLKKGEKNEENQRILTIVQWTRKLLLLQETEDIALAKKNLGRLTPSLMPKEFHAFFLKFAEKLLQGQSHLMPTIIKLIGFFGQAIKQNLEIFYFLIECIEKDAYLGCIAADTLIKLFPYLQPQDRQEILAGIQEIITKNSNIDLRKAILEKIYNSFLLFPSDEQAIFFFECLKREEQEKISSRLWKCLIYLKGMCSEKIQQEIVYFLCDYYEKILTLPLPNEELEDYTDCILSIIHKENDILLEPISKIVQILEDFDQNQYRASIHVLSMIYPSLPAARKKDIRNILERWIIEGNADQKYFAVSHVGYYYESLSSGKEIIQKILSEDFSLTEQIFISQLPLLYNKLDHELRSHIWKILTALLEKNLSFGKSSHQENIKLIAKTMIEICSYHSVEETEPLAKNLYLLLNQEDKEKRISFLFSNACSFLPYIKESWYEKFQEAAINKILLKSNSPEIIGCLLSFFSFAPFANAKIPEPCFLYIKECMNAFPDILANDALKFFTNVVLCVPEKLLQELCQDALSFMYFEEFAYTASAFFIKAQGCIPEAAEWAYRYQFHPSTYPIAFALYEIFPEELGKIEGILENYEKMRKKSPYLLGLKMADFHRQVAAMERSEELIEWILKYSKMPFIKIKALEQKRQWLLCENQGIQAHETLLVTMNLKNG